AILPVIAHAERYRSLAAAGHEPADPAASGHWAEMRRLQQRVQDLESELVRIQAEKDALKAAASHDRIMESVDAHQAEPALT
ncbi:hypothetical protein AB0D90_32105, partial [Streptomyces althioticus]|uniref:hypothetical protein n=1 Tax=Streptomyces althioticus TaxID=83380 RepID=UPI00341121AF